MISRCKNKENTAVHPDKDRKLRRSIERQGEKRAERQWYILMSSKPVCPFPDRTLQSKKQEGTGLPDASIPLMRPQMCRRVDVSPNLLSAHLSHHHALFYSCFLQPSFSLGKPASENPKSILETSRWVIRSCLSFNIDLTECEATQTTISGFCTV
jgi:hypothetical protein